MTFKQNLTRAAACAFLLAASIQTAAAESKTITELFTSQGCSSCPPADKLVPTYIKRSDVIPLTYNVDYWDYLGWKDTLAKKQYTKRWRAYGAARGDNNVYTPQTIINGMTHAVGSRKNEIDREIRKTNIRLKSHRVPVKMVMSGKRIKIELGAAPAASKIRSATIWVAQVERRIGVAIKRGENHGSKITYHNVVRELRPVGTWDGKVKTVALPATHMLAGKTKTCVVFLQANAHGPIIGAAEYRANSGT